MPILEKQVTRDTLLETACRIYEGMTKAVADVSTGALAIEGVMHADLEQELLTAGSKQESLWGFNIYPAKRGDDFLQYTSLINIRPRAGNTSILIENPEIRTALLRITQKWVTDA